MDIQPDLIAVYPSVGVRLTHTGEGVHIFTQSDRTRREILHIHSHVKIYLQVNKEYKSKLVRKRTEETLKCEIY